jgi:uncharacterized protein (DUF111 family)
MILEQVGYGCGNRRFSGSPNVLRVFIGQALESDGRGVSAVQDVVVELETNLDNLSPEIIGHTCGLLRAAGALDVWLEPVYMKKDRPGTVLHALASAGSETELSDIIISETGSLGIRRQFKQRTLAKRGFLSVMVDGAEVAVKWGGHGGRIASVTPEYESAAAAAATSGLPLREVMRRATEEAHQMLRDQEAEGRRNTAGGSD